MRLKPFLLSILSLFTFLSACNGNGGNSQYSVSKFQSRTKNLALVDVITTDSLLTFDHPFEIILTINSAETVEHVSVGIFMAAEKTPNAEVLDGLISSCSLELVKAGEHRYTVECFLGEEALGAVGAQNIFVGLDVENSISEEIESDNYSLNLAGGIIPIRISDTKSTEPEIKIRSLNIGKRALILPHNSRKLNTQIDGSVAIRGFGKSILNAALSICVLENKVCVPLLLENNDRENSLSVTIPEISSGEELSFGFRAKMPIDLVNRLKNTITVEGAELPIIASVIVSEDSSFSVEDSFESSLSIFPSLDQVKNSARTVNKDINIPLTEDALPDTSADSNSDVSDPAADDTSDSSSEVTVNTSPSSLSSPTKFSKSGGKSFHWGGSYFGVSPSVNAEGKLVAPNGGNVVDMYGEANFSTNLDSKILGHEVELAEINGSGTIYPSNISQNAVKLSITVLNNIVTSYNESGNSIEKSVEEDFTIGEEFERKFSLGIVKIKVHAHAGGTISLNGDLSLTNGKIITSVGPAFELGATAEAFAGIKHVAGVGVEGSLDLVNDTFSVAQTITPIVDINALTISGDFNQSISNQIVGPNGKIRIYGKINLIFHTYHKSLVIASFSTGSFNETLLSENESAGPFSF